MKKLILSIAIIALFILPAVYAEDTALAFTKDWAGADQFYFPSIVKENQEFTVFLEVNNTGFYNATNVNAILTLLDNSWITSASNNNTSVLEPSGLLKPAFTIKVPTQGAYDITAAISGDNTNTLASTKSLEVISESSIIVAVGKPLLALSHSALGFARSIYAGADYTLGFDVTNGGARKIDSVAITIGGINSSSIISNIGLTDIGIGETKTAQIIIRPPVAGDYLLSVGGTAWYNVSLSKGETSYEAFTQVASIDASWNGFPYNSYWVNSVDNIANDWSNSKSWSYYKDNSPASCGVGCKGGVGCSGGDIVSDNDVLELKYGGWTSEDWINWFFTPSEIGSVTLNVTNRPLPPPQPSSGDSGGGGGGSGVSAPAGPILPQESVKFGNLKAGAALVVPVEKSDDLGVTEVKLEVGEDVQNAIIKVLKDKEKPASVPDPTASGGSGTTYSYLEMQKINFADQALDKATITFKVEASWFADNGLDEETVALQRYHDNAWVKLPTIRKSGTASFIYYKAETPGFSTFAITAEKKIEEPKVSAPEDAMPAKDAGPNAESAGPTGFVTLVGAGKIGAIVGFSFLFVFFIARFIYVRRIHPVHE